MTDSNAGANQSGPNDRSTAQTNTSQRTFEPEPLLDDQAVARAKERVGGEWENPTRDDERAGQKHSDSDDERPASVRPEPQPQRFAEVHTTVDGAIQFVDDDQPGRWITCDSENLVEVVR